MRVFYRIYFTTAASVSLVKAKNSFISTCLMLYLLPQVRMLLAPYIAVLDDEKHQILLGMFVRPPEVKSTNIKASGDHSDTCRLLFKPYRADR